MSFGGKLDGRVALVTGASRGLGLAIAHKLVAEGARVWIGGRDPDAIGEACKAMGAMAQPLPFDITDEQACTEAIEKLAAEGLDILVNNVGERDRRSFDEIGRRDMAELLESNLVSPFDLARRAVPLMRARAMGALSISRRSPPISPGAMCPTLPAKEGSQR